MTNTVVLNGTTYTDDNDPLTGLAAGGHRERFVPALSNMIIELQSLSGRLTATSTTSVAIGTGSKVFTLASSGKSFTVGQYVIAYQTSTPANYMIGQVTGFTDPTLTISVASGDTGGSGTITAWTITICGRKGETGATGSTGLTGPAGAAIWVAAANVAGTADAITLTPSPALGSYTAGAAYEFLAEGTNTGAVTVNVSGLGTKAVTDTTGTALTAGKIVNGSVYRIVYDGTAFRLTTAATSSGSGGGGLPSGLASYYYALTVTKTKATPTVTSGNELLIYGFDVINTTASTPITIDIYVYASAVETQLVKGLPIPAGAVLEVGNLEPIFRLAASDEIRVAINGGTGTMVFYAPAQTTSTGSYEMKVNSLTASYVSQLAAITGSTAKRPVSCLVGNYLGTAAATVSIQAYQNTTTTAWDLRSAVSVSIGSILQAVVDGLGPSLILSDEWRMRASQTTTLTAVTVAKVT